MANEPETATGGVFIDTKTGNLVHKAPEEGIQLVVPGGEIDDAAKSLIEAQTSTEPPKTVTTPTAKKS